MKNKAKEKYNVEFHVHTRYSKDSFLGKVFLFLMCKIKKIDCIAITDHNEIDGAIKYKKFFERHKIDVIVGEEIFTNDGEIIGLFLKEKIEPSLSAEETIVQIKKQNGIVYIPHPYDEKRNKTVIKTEILNIIYKDADLIECHNGRNIKIEFSNKQEEIANKYNIKKVVGSDAHAFYEIGRNYCVVGEKINRNNIKSVISKAEFKTKKCIRFAHFHTKIVRLAKMIKGGQWNELSGIINKKLNRNR